ncbi:hypothetical protein TSUD_284390 [Trifolium subterraneum]|uniref:Reverse transcriptase domain-containing protein n=1 Tax=Trifolium subterraneum TaxID=3900 RepID=A0A2Z6PA71_TRISU|nr:hypothetical protein TSUD_284390 [Trifolium subterraneum]
MVDEVDGWGGYVLKEKLKFLKISLKEWYISYSRNVPSRIDSLKDRLSVLDCKGKEEGLTEGEILELHGITSDIHFLTRMNKHFRRRRNALASIMVNSQRVEGVQPVKQAMYTHFSSYFKAVTTVSPGVDDLQFPTLSFSEGGDLVKPFSVEEVRAAVWDCDSYKSSGPDGVHFGFVKEFWGEMKDDIMRFLDEFHRNDRLTKVGSIYKILAKVLANRLRKVVGSVVSEVQSAFVKERQILDGILIANEVVDDARKLHKELLLFKVDFKKVYDSVDWGYLETVMRKMAFPTLWRKWIRECVSTAMASVLVNGSPTDELPLERRLQQGDPLSPVLFLLATEGLNVMMRAMIQSSLFTGYTIGTKLPVVVSHLQFADDTLLQGVKSWANVRSLRAVLVLFEAVSGLKVNFHKSMLVGVNIADSWLVEAACVLGCRVGMVPFMYLGLPIGGEPRHLSFSEPVVNRIRSRLNGWKSHFLSFGGRLVLLKLVLTSLPVYALSFFKAPSGGKFLGLVGKMFACERRLGGWGVLAARYGEHVGRVRKGGQNRSTWSREIVRLRDAEGAKGEMGWFADGVERQHKLKMVAKMRDFGWGSGGAAWLWRRQLWVWEEEMVAECRDLLSNIVLQTTKADKWVWRHDTGGGYTVQGAYNLLTRTDMVVEDDPKDLI